MANNIETPAAKTPPVALATEVLGEGNSPESSRTTVFVFVSTECPVANRYAPEIQRLSKEYGAAGIEFRLVYPNADENSALVAKHLEEFGYHLQACLDPGHRLVKAAGVHTTPECAVYLPKRGWIYHGRIDDRYAELGRSRMQAVQQDLREVLQSIVDGHPLPTHSTRAIGCTIANLQ